MLPQPSRISKAIFRKLKRPTKTFVSDHLIARVFTPVEPQKSRFSVSVSKKVEKKAVGRNKMRRVAYDSIRDNGGLLKKNFFAQFVFSSKPTEQAQIPVEIKYLLEKMGEIHKT